MYEEVYAEMVAGGIAAKLDTPIWLDKTGQIVESEEEAFGMKTQYILTHPQKLLIVDEVRSNTSQAKDGNCGGEKYLVPNELRPQIKAACKDTHFTMLGFTAASSEPVMCAVIFATKELDPTWVLGLDPFSPWVSSDDNDNQIKQNMGKGKIHPLGPECEFMGKTIPTFCCCSESGSIMAELLTQMLMTIDKHDVFE